MMQRSNPFTIIIAMSIGLSGAMVPTAHAERDPNTPGVWRNLNVTPGPIARKHQVMVFDAPNNRILMHGGENHDVDDENPLGDVWALNLTGTPAWEEIWAAPDPLRPPGQDVPDPRHGHSGAFAGGRLVILGGRKDMIPTAPESGFLKDAWALTQVSVGEYDWQWLSDGPTTGADVCEGGTQFTRRTHAAAAAKGSIIYMMGGQEASQGTGMRDTWSMNTVTPGSSWGHMSGELGVAIDDHSGDPGCGFTVLPDFRYWHSMITDTRFNRLIIFGGQYAMEGGKSNAWTSSNGSVWSFIGAVPTVPGIEYDRVFHSAVYDYVGQRMIVLGGENPVYRSTVYSAVTSLKLPYPFPPNTHQNDGGEWSILGDYLPTTGPGPIAEHAAIYDSNADRMIVFGGVLDPSGTLRPNDVWALEFNTVPPGTISNLSATPLTASSMVVSWTAPGDDGTYGTAEYYDMRASTLPITNFNSADLVPELPTPALAGTSQSVTITGLQPSTTYYFAMKTTDDSGNTSFISNGASGTTHPALPATVTLTGETGRTTAALSWTAPGDDGNVGTAAAYDLRRSSSPITTGNFNSAIQITTNSPQPAGSTECAEVNGLVKCNTYYYALKTQDTDGNWSAMSNVLTLTQKCNFTVAICLEGGNALPSVEPSDVSFLRVQSPASGRSVVEFALSPDVHGGALDAAVFDVTGRRVFTLESGTARSGSFSRAWNLDNADGSPAPAGLYFVRVVAGKQLMTERIVVVR